MKILILGSRGMLGSTCMKYFSKKKYSVFSLDERFDYHNYYDYFAKIESYEPEIIINCVGKIKQKTDSFSDLMSINAVFPHLISLKKPKNSILVQPSTDCVFSGNLKKGLYSFDDIKDAIDSYGVSKLFGESAIVNNDGVLVLRGSIIGLTKTSSSSLMDWFLDHNDGDTVNGYENHFWNGITTLQWCKCLEQLIENKFLNTYSLLQFGTESIYSKYDLLNKVNSAFKRDIKINPLKTDKDVNRCLKSSFPFDIPHIEDQLKDLNVFLNDTKYDNS